MLPCAYHTCINNTKTGGVTFFALPKDKRRLIWIENSGNLELKEKANTVKNIVFCEKHFLIMDIKQCTYKKMLSKTAVPIPYQPGILKDQCINGSISKHQHQQQQQHQQHLLQQQHLQQQQQQPPQFQLQLQQQQLYQQPVATTTTSYQNNPIISFHNNHTTTITTTKDESNILRNNEPYNLNDNFYESFTLQNSSFYNGSAATDNDDTRTETKFEILDMKDW